MQRAGTSHRVLVIDLVARSVGRLKEGPLRRIKPQGERFHGDVEVSRLRGTHDRNVTVGAAGYPGHRDVGRAPAPARGDFAHAPRDLAINVIAVVFLVEVVSRARGGAGTARKEAARERTEGRDGDALIPAVGEHLPLFLTIEQ